MVERCVVAEERLEGRDFATFKDDPDLFDATAYRLQAIGEARTKLDAEITDAYDIAWKDIIGMRQILSHSYLAVSAAIIWKTATENIGALKEACKAALAKEKQK